MTDSNHENGDGGNNGLNLNNMLEALLRASQGAEDGDNNLENLDTFSGEYSSLNNTMDELNKFMDRWEERHDRLRDEIREVLSEQEQEDDETNDGTEGTQTEPANDELVEAQKLEVVASADASHCQSQTEGDSSSKPNDVSKQVPQSESDQRPETSPS